MVVGFWVQHSMTKNPLISTDFRPLAENDNINLLTYPIGIKRLSPVGFGDWTYPSWVWRLDVPQTQPPK